MPNVKSDTSDRTRKGTAMEEKKRKMSKITGKRLFFVCFGVGLIGLSSALLRTASLGTDPFGCMNLGVSGLIRMDFGTYQLLVNIVLLLPMLVWMRYEIGIGSFINMIGVGYVSDFFVIILSGMGISADAVTGSMILRIIMMAAGVLILCLGAAMYMEADLGYASYDALGEIIPIWTQHKIPFFAARVMTDVLCVLIGVLTGSVAGVATVITAFFTGPLVSFFRKHVSKVLSNPCR